MKFQEFHYWVRHAKCTWSSLKCVYLGLLVIILLHVFVSHLVSVDVFVFAFVITFVPEVLVCICASPDKCTDHCLPPSHPAVAAPNSEVEIKLEIAPSILVVVQNPRLKTYFRNSGENGIREKYLR